VDLIKKKLIELWKKRWFRVIVGGVVGSILGYTYYYFWGCNGSCSITSSPIKTIGFGIVLGSIWLS
jgi:hypothetical protein